MKLLYLANIRMPTEKAHGLTIVKSCEAFARAGVEVTLVVPTRETHIREDLFEAYDIEKNFTLKRLPALDLLRFSQAQWAFWVSHLSFLFSAFFWFLFKNKKDIVLYTRDAPLLLLSWLGMPAFLESHHVFEKKSSYFSFARCARGIITISRSLKEKFIAAGFSEKKIMVSPSGVDLSIFAKETDQQEARKELSLPQDTKIAVYTGNFTTMGADKGIQSILEALSHTPDIFFVAVGGSEKDIQHYTREAKARGVEERVTLIGSRTQKVLAFYQRAGDVLLMPYPATPHFSYNMSPVKMFEYMASGRAIVATDLPTIREVLNEDNAVLVPPGEPQKIAEAVSMLIENREKAAQLASRAASDVKKYSWEERTRGILIFIQELS